MAELIPYLRIFLSSPGDVNAERKIAQEIMERLPYRPAFRDRLAFRIVAWDKVGADTPMRATLAPQEAINLGLPKPSDCDLVIVIFWGRMGTPFSDENGTEYLSGTHWELMDALHSDRAETVIYRRMEPRMFDIDDVEAQEQYKRVREFFQSELFLQEGRIRRGINHYHTLDDFRMQFETHFEALIVSLLERITNVQFRAELRTTQDIVSAPGVQTVEPQAWPQDRSPFPGLRAFTREDADIYFGRDHEIDALIAQLTAQRFVTVVGSSGSGKSSLVAAGLLPRLSANVISDETTGSKDWFIVQFTPREAPTALESLAAALISQVPTLAPSDPIAYADQVTRLVHSLNQSSDRLRKILEQAIKDAKPWTEILIMIEQFEEIFASGNHDEARQFVAMFKDVTHSKKVRVIITVRADYYQQMVAFPEIVDKLRSGTFPLSMPKRDALRDMIERPAERAGVQGLDRDSRLVTRILDDLGDEPGNLPLLAFTLDELYKRAAERQELLVEIADYEGLGGVQGALGRRADVVLTTLAGSDDEKQSTLYNLFRNLLVIDEAGSVLRKRYTFRSEDIHEPQWQMIDALVDARLLVASGDSEYIQIEVAHEALFRGWKRLANWIEQVKDDLALWHRVTVAAYEWERSGFPEYLRWSAERLTLVYAMINRLQPTLTEIEQQFIEPEQDRLTAQLQLQTISVNQRIAIGDRLAVLGDTRTGIGLNVTGIPILDWLPVTPGGGVTIAGCLLDVSPFYIARYPITVEQFAAFISHKDGYQSHEWWVGFPVDADVQELREPQQHTVNYPRDTLSWYQAVAFSRWLNHHMQGQEFTSVDPTQSTLTIGHNAHVRLPTEAEWQWTAQGDNEKRAYPWGTWHEDHANTVEIGIGRSSAVGLFPYAAAKCGALDMAGNLWEWCLNDYEDPTKFDSEHLSWKALRGGSYKMNSVSAQTDFRVSSNPLVDGYYYTARLVIAFG